MRRRIVAESANPQNVRPDQLLGTPLQETPVLKKKSEKLPPQPVWRQWLFSRLKEGGLIALAALCLFMWMALLTYDPQDPGWSLTSSGEQVQNAGGRLGAWCANVLFFILGHFAYLFPLLLMVKVLQVFRHRHQAADWSGWLISWRVIGLLFLVLSGSALVDIHFNEGGLPASAGGVLGESLSRLAVEFLNIQGSTLLFIALFLFGLTVFTELSWFRVMEITGKITLDLLELVQSLINRWWDARSQRRQEVARSRELEARASELVAPLGDDLRQQKKVKERLLERDKTLAKSVSEREKRTPPVIAAPEQPKTTEPSKRVLKEKQAPLFVDSAVEGTLPPISLLDRAEKKQKSFSPESLEMMSRLLEIKLKEFGVEVIVESVHPGPVITRFEIQPAAGIKVSRISGLAKDLARALAVISVRVVEVIPGKTTIGIEIPNEDRQIVRFSEVLSSPEYDDAKSPVTMALGHDIGGRPVIADLARMPHLLVAGTTGSGKSVGVNAMILSILFKSTPEDARLIMIDPKMLELSIYEGIPHLLCPVVTDMKEAANALRWSVAEMERRYKLMSAMGVRNLAGFNRKVKDAIEAGTPLTDPLYKRQKHGR
jgi:DNA segregation ATPase FtsK/SpoIIIE, S-DNA-T family